MIGDFVCVLLIWVGVAVSLWVLVICIALWDLVDYDCVLCSCLIGF